MNPRILIACIGNVFLGDDAWGVEMGKRLADCSWPEGVLVVDFGIRGYDLAYALTDPYDAVILVDAAPRGEPPGTLYLIEVDLAALPDCESGTADAHNLNPVCVLQIAQALGEVRSRVFVVGCEPAPLKPDATEFQLSAPAQAALPEAVRMVEEIVRDLVRPKETAKAGFAPA